VTLAHALHRLCAMDYLLVPILIFFGLLLLGGITLIADAAVRAFRGR